MTQYNENITKSQVTSADLCNIIKENSERLDQMREMYKKAIERKRLSNRLYEIYYQKYGDPKNPIKKK